MLHLILSIFIGALVLVTACSLSNKNGVNILTFIIVVSAAYVIGSGILSLFGF